MLIDSVVIAQKASIAVRTVFFFSHERESQLTTVHGGCGLVRTRGRNTNILLNISYFKCLIPFWCKFIWKLKMVLRHSMSVLHYIICVTVKCARVQLYGLPTSEAFLETRYVSLEPTLPRKFLKK